MTNRQQTVPWRPLGKTGVHYWLVQRMAKVCDVDTAKAVEDGDLEPESWAGIVTRCRSCRWVDGCERWLAQQDGASGAHPPSDCLNGNVLALLAERQSK